MKDPGTWDGSTLPGLSLMSPTSAKAENWRGQGSVAQGFAHPPSAVSATREARALQEAWAPCRLVPELSQDTALYPSPWQCSASPHLTWHLTDRASGVSFTDNKIAMVAGFLTCSR